MWPCSYVCPFPCHSSMLCHYCVHIQENSGVSPALQCILNDYFAISVADCCCRHTMTAGSRTFLVLLFGVVVSLGQDTLSMHSAAATTTSDASERQHVSGNDVTDSPSSEAASSSSETSTTAAKNMPEKTLDSTSIKAVEKALLNALGLKSKPKPNKNIHIAPYMLELYNMHMQRHQRRPNRGQRPIPAGNTIRSFEPRGAYRVLCWIYNTIQCNAIQCSAMQCSAMQCNAVQCSAVQCSAAQRSAIQ